MRFVGRSVVAARLFTLPLSPRQIHQSASKGELRNISWA
jgi:hypothetical protein